MKKFFIFYVTLASLTLFPLAVMAEDLPTVKFNKNESNELVNKSVNPKVMQLGSESKDVNNLEGFTEIIKPLDKKQKNEIIKNNLSDYIEITKKEVTLNSRLNNLYKGYEYKITSNNPKQTDLVIATVQNGINGQLGYISVEKSSGATIASYIGGGFLLGIVSLGITFLVALVTSPIIYFYNDHENHKARNEGLSFSNIVPTGPINAGESLTFMTLIPIKETPVLKLTFRDIESGQLFIVSK